MSRLIKDGGQMPPFLCPVCRQPLFRDGGSLRCAQRHAYDIARQGYVNLLRHRPDTLYEDKTLFAARRAVYEAGFFDPVARAIRAALPQGVVLDAGCGEGSMLERITAGGRGGIGLDIARPAVQMAAGAYKRHAWCVGDVCALPLGDASVDGVLNMLTPANYLSFARVLRPGGLLLKVVPNPGHLLEVRKAAGKALPESEAEETDHGLTKRFAPAGRQTLRYTVACDEALAQQVFAMTPLTAHTTLQGAPPTSVTVDVTLLIGRKEPAHAAQPAPAAVDTGPQLDE